MILALLLPLLFGIVHAQKCAAGWSEHAGSCYKHFDSAPQRLFSPNMRKRCRDHGAILAVGENPAERQFMEQLNRLSFKGKENEYNIIGDQLFVDVLLDIFNVWNPFTAVANFNRPMPWCKPPVPPLLDRCLVHKSFASNLNFCYQNVHCNGVGTVGFRRYVCKKGN